MGYAGKLSEKEQAIKLRKRGLSYKEILKKVIVSKSTLSIWCRHIALTTSQLERLENRKLKGAELGRFRGAKIQQQIRIEKTKMLIRSGIKEVGNLNKRDRFIAGIALYLGDGLKGDQGVGFSNSNPKIVRFMMKWFREFCSIPESKFTGQIWIHDNLNESKAKKFWSVLTNIPLSQLQKSYVAKNKTESKKIRKKLHKNGVFAIRVNSREKQRKLIGWMSGVLGKPLI